MVEVKLYKCPVCGNLLVPDYEIESEVVFYCYYCKKNIKLKKKNKGE